LNHLAWRKVVLLRAWSAALVHHVTESLSITDARGSSWLRLWELINLVAASKENKY
jgi:hypothetical protein